MAVVQGGALSTFIAEPAYSLPEKLSCIAPTRRDLSRFAARNSPVRRVPCGITRLLAIKSRETRGTWIRKKMYVIVFRWMKTRFTSLRMSSSLSLAIVLSFVSISFWKYATNSCVSFSDLKILFYETQSGQRNEHYIRQGSTVTLLASALYSVILALPTFASQKLPRPNT